MFLRPIPQLVLAGSILGSFWCQPLAFAQTEPANGVVITNNAVYTTFQVPGCPYTEPTAINDGGVVTGRCSATASGQVNGFVRDASGSFTIFNAAPDNSTSPTGINVHGAITGFYATGSNTAPFFRGFVRSPAGMITTFDVETPSFAFDTYPNGINAAGAIVGSWGENVPSGFLRAADGTITEFSDAREYKGITPLAINDAGQITGSVFEYITDLPLGFVRSTDGTIALVANFFGSNFLTYPIGINRQGTIAGVGNLFNSNQDHGFIESADGTVTLFDLQGPAGGTISFTRLVGGGINAKNEVAVQGFLRSPNGTSTTIDLGPCIGVTAQAINDNGIVTGNCSVPGQPTSGFLWRKR